MFPQSLNSDVMGLIVRSHKVFGPIVGSNHVYGVCELITGVWVDCEFIKVFKQTVSCKGYSSKVWAMYNNYLGKLRAYKGYLSR